MTINHIDQLTEWWEGAEIPNADTLPRDGDRIIIRYNAEWYEIATADGDAGESEIGSHTRILARAPKPKPAWHDAVAVTARYDDTPMRYALLRDGDRWISVNDEDFMDDELEDVTPLIEARVTDEMVERGAQAAWVSEMGNSWASAWEDEKDITRNTVRTALTAALGLETE